MRINLGAFSSPLICGTLGQRFGRHYGFGAAGINMVAGLCLYL
jgi:POT family proton-dependent oligopeptide transporter